MSSDKSTKSNAKVLDRLYAVITSRKGGDPEKSYTAKLFARGTDKIAQKVGEEAVETVIASIGDEKPALVAETADLLYHLLVVLHMRGVAVDDVMAELQNRTQRTGLQEKAARRED